VLPVRTHDPDLNGLAKPPRKFTSPEKVDRCEVAAEQNEATASSHARFVFRRMKRAVRKLWGQKPYGTYPLMRRARQNTDKPTQIAWPAFAVAACSVSDPFWKACGDDYINSGLLNRFCLFDAGVGGTEIVKATRNPAKLNGWMVQAIKSLLRCAIPPQGPPATQGHLAPRKLTWADPRVEQAFLDTDADIRRMPEGRKRDIFIRAAEIGARLATGAAVYDGTTAVTAEHWEWGWTFANYSCSKMLEGANQNMQVRRDFAEICDHIKHLLAPGPMKWEELRKHCRSAATQWGMEIVDKAIVELTSCGEIREIPHREQIERELRPKVGAPGRRFELT
jgi:hypothetical protein